MAFLSPPIGSAAGDDATDGPVDPTVPAPRVDMIPLDIPLAAGPPVGEPPPPA
jgi:hypothetical protein